MTFVKTIYLNLHVSRHFNSYNHSISNGISLSFILLSPGIIVTQPTPQKLQNRAARVMTLMPTAWLEKNWIPSEKFMVMSWSINH